MASVLTADQLAPATTARPAARRAGGRVARGGAVRRVTPVVRRGTHRTRVSEKRLVDAPVAASRPEVTGATRQAGRVAAERDRGGRVHPGTG